MKEKIINYIETLEAKAYQSDGYFKQRNDLYIENQNKDKEIEKLKELIIALWHNDNARLLNKEQIDLLNNIVFGNDEEDLGSDKE